MIESVIFVSIIFIVGMYVFGIIKPQKWYTIIILVIVFFSLIFIVGKNVKAIFMM